MLTARKEFYSRFRSKSAKDVKGNMGIYVADDIAGAGEVCV